MNANGVANAMGLKGAVVVAGFAGAVVSLTFVKELSRAQVIIAVAVGSVSAGYLTPVFLSLLRLDPGLQNGVAFLVGLTAMNIVPGILRLTEFFRKDPSYLVEHIPLLALVFRREKKGGE